LWNSRGGAGPFDEPARMQACVTGHGFASSAGPGVFGYGHGPLRRVLALGSRRSFDCTAATSLAFLGCSLPPHARQQILEAQRRHAGEPTVLMCERGVTPWRRGA